MVDWSKPIELMDGTEVYGECSTFSGTVKYLVNKTKDRSALCFVGKDGDIGGVPVVRNREEPKKVRWHVWVNIYSKINSQEILTIAFPSRAEADSVPHRVYPRIACIEIDREITEGDGL